MKINWKKLLIAILIVLAGFAIILGCYAIVFLTSWGGYVIGCLLALIVISAAVYAVYIVIGG